MITTTTVNQHVTISNIDIRVVGEEDNDRQEVWVQVHHLTNDLIFK